MFVFGRSIGSGPACYLAQKRQTKMTILFSPYTSIRDVAKEHVSVFAYFVKNRFDNLKHVQGIVSPIFLLHGQIDEVISVSHSEKLFKVIKHEDKVLIKPPHMTHNDFRIESDFIFPLKKFVNDTVGMEIGKEGDYDMPNLNVIGKFRNK